MYLNQILVNLHLKISILPILMLFGSDNFSYFTPSKINRCASEEKEKIRINKQNKIKYKND